MELVAIKRLVDQAAAELVGRGPDLNPAFASKKAAQTLGFLAAKLDTAIAIEAEREREKAKAKGASSLSDVRLVN